MNNTSPDPLNAIVVAIHKVHCRGKHRWVTIEFSEVDSSSILVLIAIQGLEEAFKCKATRGILLLEILLQPEKCLSLRKEAEVCIRLYLPL